MKGRRQLKQEASEKADKDFDHNRHISRMFGSKWRVQDDDKDDGWH